MTCRLPFISEPHGTHDRMLLETSPGYEWATSVTIIAHMHTEIQVGGHEYMWFYEKLEQTYKAIIQIACKNAE